MVVQTGAKLEVVLTGTRVNPDTEVLLATVDLRLNLLFEIWS